MSTLLSKLIWANLLVWTLDKTLPSLALGIQIYVREVLQEDLKFTNSSHPCSLLDLPIYSYGFYYGVLACVCLRKKANKLVRWKKLVQLLDLDLVRGSPTERENCICRFPNKLCELPPGDTIVNNGTVTSSFYVLCMQVYVSSILKHEPIISHLITHASCLFVCITRYVTIIIPWTLL